jgi:hypothetical protein
MALVNGNMDENYYKEIIKNIGYIYNDLFDKDDVKMITDTTFFDPDDDDIVDELTNMGKNQGSAAQSNNTIWQNLNKQTFHAFERIYSKLICCLGDKKGEGKEMKLTVPVYNPAAGKVEFVPKIFNIPNKAACEFRGDNYYDDGTEGGYNAKCEYLMQKYCFFLQKYDKENKLIDDLCGCLLPAKYLSNLIDWTQPVNEKALLDIQDNRKCGIGKCMKTSAFKRREDRKACAKSITICTNTLNISDNEIGKEMSLNGLTQSNDCGGGSPAAVPKSKDAVKDDEEDQKKLTDAGHGGSNSGTNTQGNTKPAEDEASTQAKKPAKKPAKKTAKKTAKKSAKKPAKKSAAVIEEEVGFFQSIIDWFAGLFGSEGFSPKNDKFDFLYSIFSIIVLYMLVLKDPLRISKKINKMF